MSKVTFNNQKAFFYNTVSTKVEEYFNERHLKKTGDTNLYLKSAFLISAAVATYIILLTVHLNPFVAALLCCLLGLEQAVIGFNVMHDANHGSYSQRKWINNVMSLSANMMGSNSWIWKQKHNIIHHTYTNVDGIDDDISKAPILRMCPSQKQFKLHRFQYIYCIPVYGFASLFIFLSDFSKYFNKRVKSTRLQKMQTREHIIFWISKILYIVLFIVFPAMQVGLWPTLAGFALMHVTLGITLGLVFQLAHVVEATHFVEAEEKGLHIDDEWAIHQVRTTADFATGNKVISWFTGGLNYQVEHHLFPKISHIHYPAIHKIVKEACMKHAIRFNSYTSMTAALQSHLRFLKQLGMQ